MGCILVVAHWGPMGANGLTYLAHWALIAEQHAHSSAKCNPQGSPPQGPPYQPSDIRLIQTLVRSVFLVVLKALGFVF